ncbi:MAG: DUF2203 domain-containing protein [Planctomycetes bacterium]|nr:DUF2203 domain-containing protein [Planctomycetota bacterium]
MSSKLAPRTQFTVATANKALPLVRAIVQDIVDLYGDVREREQRLSGLRRGTPGKAQQDDPYSEEVEQIRLELEKDVEKLEGFVEELTELGVEFKDPVIGLVDFPSTINGQEVYLCWKLGEPAVEFWHTHDAGFQGRQRLDETTAT